MVLTYRALQKTYPFVCEAIVEYAHKHQLLFEAALDEYIESVGISVVVDSVRDAVRSNKIAGYSFRLSLKNAVAPGDIKDDTLYTRDLYAWQQGVRKALRILDEELAAKPNQQAAGISLASRFIAKY